MKRIDLVRREISRAFSSQVRSYAWTVFTTGDNYLKVMIEIKEQIGEPYSVVQLDISKVLNFKIRIEKLSFKLLPWQIIARNDKLCIELMVRSNKPVEDE